MNKSANKNIKNAAKQHMKLLKLAFEKFAKGSNVEIGYAREKYKDLGDDIDRMIAESK